MSDDARDRNSHRAYNARVVREAAFAATGQQPREPDLYESSDDDKDEIKLFRNGQELPCFVQRVERHRWKLAAGTWAEIAISGQKLDAASYQRLVEYIKLIEPE